jgi:thiosulfate reductase cytochrome b subunit
MEKTISHPRWLRVCHWLNAIAVILLVTSGWRIYNASPLLDFVFPQTLTLGGWLGGALQWHFAAMWLLFLNGILYLVLGFMTGYFRQKFTPLSLSGLAHDLRQLVQMNLTHANLSRYNMIQKLAYIGVVACLITMVASGLVLWKPVQFPTLRLLLGDYEVARLIHFISMALICLFILVHVIMVALVPRTLKGMILGHH